MTSRARKSQLVYLEKNGSIDRQKKKGEKTKHPPLAGSSPTRLEWAVKKTGAMAGDKLRRKPGTRRKNHKGEEGNRKSAF